MHIISKMEANHWSSTSPHVNTRFMIVDTAFELLLLFGYTMTLRRMREGRIAPGRPSYIDEAQGFLRSSLYFSTLYDIFPPYG